MLGGLPTREVSFGCGGLELFELSTLADNQIGFAVSTNGTSLCGDLDGDWRSDWIVVGRDTGTGDPIILDADDDRLQVMTDIIGQGSWKPKVIATSVESFAECFKEFARIAIDRDNPGKREENPLTESERASYLARIAGFNGTSDTPVFWDALLEY